MNLGSGNPPAFRWLGRRLEPGPGLYDMRARVYSASLGRFLQPDPIGTDGGINLYAYALNDTLNATDRDGLASWMEYSARGVRIVNAALTEEIAMLDQALAAPATMPRASLSDAAAPVLAAWDDQAGRFGTHEEDMIGALDAPIAALRALLAGKPTRMPREPGALRKPREGTKQEQVLAMLRRPEGATVAQIAEATDWAHHTVRGFFAGLKKKGHAVEVKSRERMVGPNKTGAMGSFNIYALAK